MTTRAIATLFAAVLFLGALVQIAFPLKARAQSSHDQHHDVYQFWRMPGSGAPCCNARVVDTEGNVKGDCYQTRAELRQGNWWVLRNNGMWVEVPDGRIIREANPDPTGESAALCMGDFAANEPSNVLCFRPPNTGG